MLKLIAKLGCLVALSISGPALGWARTVGVDEGAGNGFLFHHRENCFVMLPTHVHGARYKGIRLSDRDGAVGRADILHSTDVDTDLSLGLVTGGIARDCGPDWASLPRRLGHRLSPGLTASVVRSYQQSQELRRVTLSAVSFVRFSVVPAPGEPADLFAGTSGALVFDGQMPIGMVTDAETAGEAWVLRMDEIVGRISRWIEGTQEGRVCDDPVLAERVAACVDTESLIVGPGLPFRVTEWSAHPVDGAVDPLAMAAGEGPYVAPLAVEAPLRIEVLFPETVTVGRVVLRSEADGETEFKPRTVRIMTDATAGPVRRPLTFINRDMPPDGVLDVVRRVTYARRVTIEVLSTWGGGSPVRLDAIRFE